MCCCYGIKFNWIQKLLRVFIFRSSEIIYFHYSKGANEYRNRTKEALSLPSISFPGCFTESKIISSQAQINHAHIYKFIASDKNILFCNKFWSWKRQKWLFTSRPRLTVKGRAIFLARVSCTTTPRNIFYILKCTWYLLHILWFLFRVTPLSLFNFQVSSCIRIAHRICIVLIVGAARSPMNQTLWNVSRKFTNFSSKSPESSYYTILHTKFLLQYRNACTAPWLWFSFKILRRLRIRNVTACKTVKWMKQMPSGGNYIASTIIIGGCKFRSISWSDTDGFFLSISNTEAMPS